MIERKFQRPLHLFSWVVCGAMAVKLVVFTEFNTKRLGPHVFTDVQAYADKKLDEFFGVQNIREKAGEQSPAESSAPESSSA